MSSVTFPSGYLFRLLVLPETADTSKRYMAYISVDKVFKIISTKVANLIVCFKFQLNGTCEEIYKLNLKVVKLI